MEDLEQDFVLHLLARAKKRKEKKDDHLSENERGNEKGCKLEMLLITLISKNKCTL